MARRRLEPIEVDSEKAKEGREFLEAMVNDDSLDKNAKKRARLILTMADGADFEHAVKAVGIGKATARQRLERFNAQGWTSLITVMAPRGGDFLARYDLGFWAERLTRAYLEQSKTYRPLPYGPSRGEPFTDMLSFRQYIEMGYRQQAWAQGGRWKRPDLLTLPRKFIRSKAGNDAWDPNLQNLDNDRCARFVKQAKAAIEVETSLWEIDRAEAAGVRLSFTVKDEDLEALRNWVRANETPLFIVQVFYDRAYALPFDLLHRRINLPEGDPRRITAKQDRQTEKFTYFPPLSWGRCLGTIPEPDVEGKVFKAPNGKVTVYGRLTGSEIQPSDTAILEALADGTLQGAEDDHTPANQGNPAEDEE